MTEKTQSILFYIHDPMCSWCWGFNKTWQIVKQSVSNQVNIQCITGGLAPDSDDPMPQAMQTAIASYWQTIQQRIPGTEFNYDFWKKCHPRRSTYPACRAVLAAKTLDAEKESAMILGIQHAYYLKAKNPSDIDTLVDVAEEVGLDRTAFEQKINDPEIEQLLLNNLQFARQIGAHGFPSLFLVDYEQEKNINIPIDYNNPDSIIASISRHL